MINVIIVDTYHFYYGSSSLSLGTFDVLRCIDIIRSNDNSKWKVKIFPNPNRYCDNCEDMPTGLAGCRRSQPRVQVPMMQLYHDLLEYNSHLSNKQKRYQCYRWYSRVVHGYLGSGQRRRVCPCVDKEIHTLFPMDTGEERVGFCDHPSHEH